MKTTTGACPDDDDRGDHMALRGHVERGDAEHDRRGKRNDRRDAGHCADRGGVGDAGGKIDDAQDNPFGQPDEDEPGYRAVHRRDHLQRDAFAARAEHPVAEPA